MKSNEDKCHLLVANNTEVSVTLANENILASSSVKHLGVKIDNDLNFSKHAIARISKFLNCGKLKILMKTFITSQFNYCPLTWMFHNRTLNNKINKLHERALRLAYKYDSSSFQELLDSDDADTIHCRNLQKLAIEMYKVKNKISPLPL